MEGEEVPSFWGKLSTFYLICLLYHLSSLLFDPWPCHEKLLSTRLQTSIGKHAESVLIELLINYAYYMTQRSLSMLEGWRQKKAYSFRVSILHNHKLAQTEESVYLVVYNKTCTQYFSSYIYIYINIYECIV